MSAKTQTVPIRERRRAETTALIKRAALEELGVAGPGGMSLRGVARAVGMTVQSLYHYFPSRDALLTELVSDSHNALADAVSAAAAATLDEPPPVRLMAASLAYRDWAFAHRPDFLLIFGTPVPGFEAPFDGPTSAAATRLARPFIEVAFSGWTPEQIAALPRPAGVQPPADNQPAALAMPTGALALLLELRARMHGMVMLDLLNHLHPLQDYGRELFCAATTRTSAELEVLRAGLPRSSRPAAEQGLGPLGRAFRPDDPEHR